MNLFTFLAEAASNPDWIGPLLQFGVGGGVLVWFMFRSEPRMKGIESAIDRNTRSTLLLVIALGPAAAKEQANMILQEVNEAEKARQK